MRRILCVIIVPAALLISACSGSSPVAPSVASSGSGLAAGPAAEGQALSKGKGRGPERQIEGAIESMPSDPAGSFVVGGQLVTTDANTVVRHRDTVVSVAALAVGQRVHVKGQASPASVLAALIMIQQGALNAGSSGDTNPPPPPPPAPEEVCGNGADDDGDGQVDEDCPPPPPAPDEVCDNGIDDDGDGQVDEDCTPPPPPPAPVAAFDPDPIQGQAQCQIFTCGFAFSVSENVTVQALGQWDQGLDGLLTNGQVGLWSADGTLIASVVVPSGTAAALDGQYRYVVLDLPVELVAGQQYVIGSAMPSSTAPTFSATGASPVLTMIQGRVASGGSGVLVYPSGASASFFGGANFLFLPVAP